MSELKQIYPTLWVWVTYLNMNMCCHLRCPIVCLWHLATGVEHVGGPSDLVPHPPASKEISDTLWCLTCL